MHGTYSILIVEWAHDGGNRPVAIDYTAKFAAIRKSARSTCAEHRRKN